MALRLYDPKAPRGTYRGEETWFAVFKELQHSRLRRALIESGQSPAQAGNLVFFIEEQLTLRRHLGQATRNRYRRVLDELDPEKVLELGRSIPGWIESRHAA